VAANFNGTFVYVPRFEVLCSAFRHYQWVLKVLLWVFIICNPFHPLVFAYLLSLIALTRPLVGTLSFYVEIYILIVRNCHFSLYCYYCVLITFFVTVYM